MTDIPDDVVERAANAYGDASGDHYDCLRAALSVAVEWEREECAKIAGASESALKRLIIAAIRARSE